MVKYSLKPLVATYVEDGTTLTFRVPTARELAALSRLRFADLPTKKVGNELRVDFDRMSEPQMMRWMCAPAEFLANRLESISNLQDSEGKEIKLEDMNEAQRKDFLAGLYEDSAAFCDFCDKMLEGKKKA